MTKQYITLVVPEEIMTQLLEGGGAIEGVELGKSRPADSQTDGLDSPLGPEEIKAILQVVTVAFGTASAALVFFEKLHKLLHKPAEKPTELPSESPPVPVIMKDGRTGKRIAKIDKHSDPKELSRKAFK